MIMTHFNLKSVSVAHWRSFQTRAVHLVLIYLFSPKTLFADQEWEWWLLRSTNPGQLSWQCTFLQICTQYFGDYVHILYPCIYYRTLCRFADGLLHIKIASGFGQPYLLFSWCSKVIRQKLYLRLNLASLGFTIHTLDLKQLQDFFWFSVFSELCASLLMASRISK